MSSSSLASSGASTSSSQNAPTSTAGNNNNNNNNNNHDDGSSPPAIILERSKLQLHGKALDKYRNMKHPKMQELALQYCDSMVLQYLNSKNSSSNSNSNSNSKNNNTTDRKVVVIQKEEAFLLKRLRDFGVYYHKSVTLYSSSTNPNMSGSLQQQQQQQQQDGTNSEAESQQPPPTQRQQSYYSYLLLPKSKMKLQARALDRFLAMPLEHRIRALEYCDSHMIQRRRNHNNNNNNNNNNNGQSSNNFLFIKDEVAYMDKRLKLFWSEQGTGKPLQIYNRTSSSSASMSSSKGGGGGGAAGTATAREDDAVSVTSGITANTNFNTNFNNNTNNTFGDFLELSQSKAKIKGDALIQLRTLPVELQRRAMQYCDNIIMTRKHTPQRIVHETSFVASVIDSFDRTHKEDQLKKQQRRQWQQQNNNQNPHNPSSASTSPSKSNNNNNKNGTSTSTTYNNYNNFHDENNNNYMFLELPQTKLRVTGNALVKLQCLSNDECQRTIEYCDQVILKKRTDKKSRPIENEMAYLSSIIDAFLQNGDQNNNNGDTSLNNNAANASTSNKNNNNNNASTTFDSSTTSKNINNNKNNVLQLPQTKMKVIGNALMKLRALPIQEQERAILFCDRVVLNRDKKSRPIINETGYLASLMDNFVETQMQTQIMTEPSNSTTTTTNQQQQETTTTTSNSVTLTPASITLNTILNNNGLSSSSSQPTPNASTSSSSSNNYNKDTDNLKRDLQIAASNLQAKEERILDLTKRLEESDTTWKAKLQDATTTAKQDLSKKDETIKELQKSLADKNAALQTAQTKVKTSQQTFQATLDAKEKELDASQAQISKLQVETEAMNRTFASMTKALVTTQEEKQETTKRLEDCQVELLSQKEELQTLRTKQTTDGTTMQSLRDELANTKALLAAERSKVDELLEASDMVGGSNKKRSSDPNEKPSSLLDFVIGQAAAASNHHHHNHTDTLSSGSDSNSRLRSNSNHHTDTPFDFSQIFPENHPMPAPAPLVLSTNSGSTNGGGHIQFPPTAAAELSPLDNDKDTTTLNNNINDLNNSINDIIDIDDDDDDHNDKKNIKNKNIKIKSSDDKHTTTTTNNHHHDSRNTTSTTTNTTRLFSSHSVKQELDFLAASYGHDTLSFDDSKNCITRTLYLECDHNKESVKVHLRVTIPEKDNKIPLQVKAGIASSPNITISKEAQTLVVETLPGLVDACQREANASVGEENVIFTILQTADQWVQIEWASIQAKRLPKME